METRRDEREKQSEFLYFTANGQSSNYGIAFALTLTTELYVTINADTHNDPLL
jgi:hypothetical protein